MSVTKPIHRPHNFTTTEGWQLCSICGHPEKDLKHMPKKQTEKIDPLKPSVDVLIQLGSLAVHVEELLNTPSTFKGKTLRDALSGMSHSAEFDLAAIEQCLKSASLRAWLAGMDGMAFLPKKRN